MHLAFFFNRSFSTMNVDYIIIGLGNPGPRYAFTRHNIGFIALDLLAQEKRVLFTTSGLAKRIDAEICEVQIEDKKLLLLKPLTFMNLSGQSLSKLFQQHTHLREKPIICLHDEVDLAFGKIRIKEGGSDAGHNGLKSLRASLGHGDYTRIRMGVGRPSLESRMQVADYVLQAFSKSEEETLMKEISQTVDVLAVYLQQGLQKAQAAASKEI
jgi:PTH1 family peptidyl-tRNA hydrolase